MGDWLQANSVAPTLISRLKMLSVLFCTLHVEQLNATEGQQPVLVVVQCTLPLYKEIATKWCKNTDVMEV